jgi:hypothetical protein
MNRGKLYSSTFASQRFLSISFSLRNFVLPTCRDSPNASRCDTNLLLTTAEALLQLLRDYWSIEVHGDN